jgi:hypothetical protein
MQGQITLKIGTSKSSISRLESLNNTYMPNLYFWRGQKMGGLACPARTVALIYLPKNSKIDSK